MRAQATFDFIERCNRENDILALIEEFRARIADFGFTASVCGAWSGIGAMVGCELPLDTDVVEEPDRRADGRPGIRAIDL